jgi:hypothetical protein
MLRLVAMARSGEALIIRAAGDRLLLYRAAGLGGTASLSAEDAERVIAAAGFDRIDADFADWAELDEFRTERVRTLLPPLADDLDTMTIADVTPLVDLAERWLKEGRTPAAAALARRLLDDVPALAAEEVATQRLRRIIVDESRLLLPPSQTRNPWKQRALDRWRERCVAA